jgi:uncharacterized protein (TIGR02594 family)
MPPFRVTSAGLNLRHSPSAEDNSNLFPPPLKLNDVVEKMEESADRKWFRVRIRQNGITREGWAAAKYLAAINIAPVEADAGDPPWLTIARGELGIAGVAGGNHNPRILEYLATTTNIGLAHRLRDETDWCSAFVNWCMMQAGYVGTNHALARSWWTWTGGTRQSEPRQGCIVVFRRLIDGVDVGKGHVGFYIKTEGDHIHVLGGNQDNRVSIKPRAKADLIGFVYPNPLPVVDVRAHEAALDLAIDTESPYFRLLVNGRLYEAGLDERLSRIQQLESLLTDGEAESPDERAEIERQIADAQTDYAQADARLRYMASMPIPHPSNAGPIANWKKAWGWTTADFRGLYIIDPRAPFNDANMRNKPGEAQGSNIERIIAFLDVENTARYMPQGGSTMCTVFVYDATWLLSAEIPIAPNRAANRMCVWLEGTEAKARGWKRVVSVDEAQTLASQGFPVVATQQRPTAGHVALVRPVPIDKMQVQGDAFTAQAGAVNSSLTTVRAIFGDPSKVIFYTHP